MSPLPLHIKMVPPKIAGMIGVLASLMPIFFEFCQL